MKKLLLVTLIAACGGGSGSGIDSSKKLRDLTPTESNEECNYAFDTYPLKTVTCPDGTTRKNGEDPAKRATQCNATTNTTPAGCTVTVGEAEQCIADLYNEPDSALCSTSTSPPASCLPLFSAACQGTGRIAPATRGELLDLALELSY